MMTSIITMSTALITGFTVEWLQRKSEAVGRSPRPEPLTALWAFLLTRVSTRLFGAHLPILVTCRPWPPTATCQRIANVQKRKSMPSHSVTTFNRGCQLRVDR